MSDQPKNDEGFEHRKQAWISWTIETLAAGIIRFVNWIRRLFGMVEI